MIVVHLLIFLRLADQAGYLDQDYIDTTKKLWKRMHEVIPFSSNHNIHKISCGLCFWDLKNIWIKGSEAQK